MISDMQGNELTILTATYNRASNLAKLYESLIAQTNQEFQWLVVDDGSQDKTVEMLEEWEKEERIQMRWFRQENSGKHVALNAGIAQIETELTFIVDSDDWLTDRAVETILRYHEKYRNEEHLCGYSFLRFYSDGTVNDAFFPENEKIDTYVNVRINGHIGGDKAEVFLTSVLKSYPFPVFEGEKFVPEDLVWVRMSGPYRMVHINECIYISDYLEGGLTKSGRRMKLRSPHGMMARSLVYLQDANVHYRTKIKMMLLYQIYGRSLCVSFSEMEDAVPQKILFRICILPSCILYFAWKKRYR